MQEDQNPMPAPPRFLDAEGKEHVIRLSFGRAKQVKEKFEVDLLDINDGKAFMQIASSIPLVCSILWELSAGKEDIEDEEAMQAFADVIDGPTVERGVKALEEAIISFTPPARRPAVRAIIVQSHEAVNKMGEAMLDVVQSHPVSEAMDLVIAEQAKTAEAQIPYKMAQAAGVPEHKIKNLKKKAQGMQTSRDRKPRSKTEGDESTSGGSAFS